LRCWCRVLDHSFEMSPKDKGSVRVYCRVRPLMKNEEIRCVQVKKNEIIFNRQNSEEDCPTNSMGTQEEHLNFSFDNVFDENASQAEIFDGVRGKEVVRDVLSGYNGTLFAYGQTNAGKTHTIQGGSNSIEDDQNDGIIGRAGKALFQGVRDAKESIEFAIKVSFVEIYQERIRDLLNKYSSFGTNNGDRQSGEKQGLQIREDKQRGIYIKGCTERTNENDRARYKKSKSCCNRYECRLIAFTFSFDHHRYSTRRS